jgi:hypothetical protein
MACRGGGGWRQYLSRGAQLGRVEGVDQLERDRQRNQDSEQVLHQNGQVDLLGWGSVGCESGTARARHSTGLFWYTAAMGHMPRKENRPPLTRREFVDQMIGTLAETGWLRRFFVWRPPSLERACEGPKVVVWSGLCLGRGGSIQK